MKTTLQRLGPGILMAGAAVGVSHLVQSTRAGALYGWFPLIIILAVNVFKYPFFEYGHRYASSTGNNLLRGYHGLGKGYLISFLLLNCITATGSIALLAFITAALLRYLLLPDVNMALIAGGVLLLCWVILLIGHYKWLEHIMKWLMLFLSLATFAATIAAFVSHPPIQPTIELGLFTFASLPFLIAFMGWMPGPMEISVWQSLWVQAEAHTRGHAISEKDARFDFNVGYGLTAILACLFLAMGALTLQGQPLSGKAAVFAGQVVSMYGSVIGDWAVPFVGVAAVTAIFSTTFTLLDAYPRSLSVGLAELKPAYVSKEPFIRHTLSMLASAFAVLIITQLQDHMQLFVYSVTIIAFVTAPYVAWLNMRCVATLKPAQRPPRKLRILAIFGMIYLLLFSGIYMLHALTSII